MRFVPVREFRLHPGQVWRKLSKEQELVLTAKGRPVGFLAPLNEETFEETLRVWRQARGLIALEALQKEARRRGLNRMKSSEIDAEIRRARSRSR